MTEFPALAHRVPTRFPDEKACASYLAAVRWPGRVPVPEVRCGGERRRLHRSPLSRSTTTNLPVSRSSILRAAANMSRCSETFSQGGRSNFDSGAVPASSGDRAHPGSIGIANCQSHPL